MKVEIKKLGDCERRVEMEVPREIVNKRIEKLYLKYQKTLKMNGFRKGKIPFGIIKKRFNKTIEREAVEEVIDSCLKNLIKEKKLIPLMQGKIEEIEFKETLPLYCKVYFEVMPEIELKHYKGISIEFPTPTVTKEELDSTLKILQKERRTYTPVYMRAAQKGDLVVVDYKRERRIRGIIREERGKNYSIILGEYGVPPSITDGLINTKIGDIKKVRVTYPQDYPDPSLKGEVIDYEFVIKEIKEEKLPPIDENFAKSLGVNGVEELKKLVTEDIRRRKLAVLERRAKTQIINILIEDNPFHPPPSYVEEYYFKPLLAELMKKEGQSVDEKMKKELRDSAIWFAKRDILIEKISQKEGIQVNDKEVKNYALTLEDVKNEVQGEVISWLKKRGKYGVIVDQLKREKVLNFLLKHAKKEGK
jgi:trigger factor